MAAIQPVGRSRRSTIETTSEQVIFYENGEDKEEIGGCGLFCVKLIIGFICFAIFCLMKSFSKSSTSSTSTVYTPTRTRYTPSSSYSGRDSWITRLDQEVYQRNLDGPSCDNGYCKNMVNDVINSINKSVDPCTNFYEYACQGWEENNPKPEYMAEWSVLAKMRTQNTNRVIKILERRNLEKISKPLYDAKQFYEKCVETGNEKSEATDKAAMQLMWNNLEKYGGWPILYENGTWNKSRFNWISSTVSLKRQFQSTTLLDVTSLQFPAWMEKQNTIIIKPSSASSSSLEAIDKFIEASKLFEGFKSLLNLQNFIANISNVFLEFQGKRDINETFLQNMALETVFVQILMPSPGDPFSLSIWDKISLGMSGKSNSVNTTLSKIQFVLDKSTFPFKNELNLQKLLNALYKNSNVYISQNQVVVVSDIGYLLNLAKFLTETKEEALANYFSFRMALLMIPLSGHEELTNLVDNFQNELIGTKGKKERKEICAEITQKQFYIVLSQQFVETKHTNELELKQAKIVFNNLKVAFRNLIDSSNRRYLNKPLLELETKMTKLCLGYPSWMNGLGDINQLFFGSKIGSENRVELEYKGLFMNKSATFLEQNMVVNMWTVDKSYGLLKKQLKNHGDSNCQWTKFAGYVGAHMAILEYSVYLPLGIMQQPIYSRLMSMALIYGKLGSILGHEIIHGLEGPEWVRGENGELTESAQCLANQYSKFSTEALRKENVTLNGTTTLGENIPDNAGLLGAYKAFKQSNLLYGRVVEKVEEFREFTDDQLFFLGFAQNWCETSNEITLRESMEKDDHPPGMFRVLGSLQNSEEFSKAWKCPLGSNMNPFPGHHRKCKIF